MHNDIDTPLAVKLVAGVLTVALLVWMALWAAAEVGSVL
jgi:hypothetical protein